MRATREGTRRRASDYGVTLVDAADGTESIDRLGKPAVWVSPMTSLAMTR